MHGVAWPPWHWRYGKCHDREVERNPLWIGEVDIVRAIFGHAAHAKPGCSTKAPCGKLSTPRPPDPGQSHDACHQALAAFSGLSPSYVPEEATMLSPTTVQSLGQVRLEEMHEQARRAALAKTARRARGRSAPALPWPAAPAGPTAQPLPHRAGDPRPHHPGGSRPPWSLALRPNRAICVVRRRLAGPPGRPSRRPGGGPPQQADRPPARSSPHPVPHHVQERLPGHDDDVPAVQRAADDGPRVPAAGIVNSASPVPGRPHAA